MLRTDTDRPTPGLALAGGVLGFALGGFFDGILLHQVLQWHYFLSLVPGASMRDIENQILADGLFHVAVYGIAALGFWLLWRARGGFAADAADRRLLGAALLGFAAWQAVDIVGIHWLIGIHRVRVDVPDPLKWDIGWLVATGVPPLLAGLWLWRGRGEGPRPGHRGRGAAVAATLALAVLGAAPVAALPAPGVTTALVLFGPGSSSEDALAAVLAAGARPIAVSAGGGVLLADLREADVSRLYRSGAVLVTRSAAVAGCRAAA